MKLSAPKQVTWWIAIILGVIGILGILVTSIPVLSIGIFGGVTIAVLLLIVGFVLLALGTLIDGL